MYIPVLHKTYITNSAPPPPKKDAPMQGFTVKPLNNGHLWDEQ